MKKTSTRFSLKVLDFLKGLILGVGTPILYALQELIPNYPLTPIEKIALSAFIAYLIKNYFTDDVKVATKTFQSENLSVTDGVVYDDKGNIVGGRPNDRP